MSEELEPIDNEEEIHSIEMSLASPGEDIYSAYTALTAIDGIDAGLLTNKKEFDYKIRMIKEYSINIIYENLKYINDYTVTDESGE